MKQTLLLVVFLAIGLSVSAQSKTLDSLTHHRHLQEGDFKLNIPGFLIRAAIAMSTTDDSDASKALNAIRKKLRKAQIMVLDNRSISSFTMKKIHQELHESGFEDFVQIRDEGQYVNILVHENKEVIRRMMVTIYEGEGQFVAFDLKTKLTFDELSTLLNEMDTSM